MSESEGTSETGDGDGDGDGENCWRRVHEWTAVEHSWIEVDGELLVAGEQGVLRFDGQAWSQIDYAPEQSSSVLWASAVDDVWTVGPVGVWRYDGQTVTEAFSVESGFGTDTSLGAIWGAGPDDVWVGGHTQTIDESTVDLFHFDGAEWTRADFDAPGLIFSLWGTASDDIWAASSGGILHWDGQSWTLDDPHPLSGNSRIWGPAGDDLWATDVGQGLVLRYDGDAWVELPTPGTVASIWGPASDELFAVGYDDVGPAMWSWNGASFEPMAMPALDHWPSVAGYAGEPLLLSREAIARHVDGGFEPWLSAIQADHLGGVWVADADRILAVDGDRLLGLLDGEWQMLARVGEQLDGLLVDVAARSLDDAFVVGHAFDLSQPRVFHYDGGSLNPVEIPDPEYFQPAAAYADPSGSVWIVGQNSGWEELPDNDPDYASRVLRAIEGTSFEDLSPAGYTSGLAGVGGGEGHVFAFGWDGTVLHHDGEQWTSIDPGFDEIQAMYAAGPEDVYVVRFANGGEIHRWDGDTWQQPPALEGFRWRTVGGSGPNDVYALAQAEEGELTTLAAHFDGEQWSFVDGVPTGESLGGGEIHGSEAGDLLFMNNQAKWVYSECG